MTKLEIPITEEQITNLKVGDEVSLNGFMVTGRDAAHKYIVETFVKKEPTGADKELYDKLYKYLNGGVIYHCGPVVKEENGKYSFVAAGPTTSAREEPYQADVMKCFGLRGVIGKGGMFDKTLQGCQDNKAVYFHAVGGAGSLIAKNVIEVVGVEKLEFGTPEAFWIIKVENFKCVVTMDCHGNSLHKKILANSGKKLKELLSS